MLGTSKSERRRRRRKRKRKREKEKADRGERFNLAQGKRNRTWLSLASLFDSHLPVIHLPSQSLKRPFNYFLAEANLEKFTVAAKSVEQQKATEHRLMQPGRRKEKNGATEEKERKREEEEEKTGERERQNEGIFLK